MLHRQGPVAESARQPCVPWIIDGVVGTKLRLRFLSWLDLPEWTVLVHVGYDEQLAVLLHICFGEFSFLVDVGRVIVSEETLW